MSKVKIRLYTIYSFIAETFTTRTNAKHINIGTFAPQNESNISVVNMKHNIKNMHMESELGIVNNAKTKVDTFCHYNLKITT
jgi:hypothetical protein